MLHYVSEMCQISFNKNIWYFIFLYKFNYQQGFKILFFLNQYFLKTNSFFFFKTCRNGSRRLFLAQMLYKHTMIYFSWKVLPFKRRTIWERCTNKHLLKSTIPTYLLFKRKIISLMCLVDLRNYSLHLVPRLYFFSAKSLVK